MPCNALRVLCSRELYFLHGSAEWVETRDLVCDHALELRLQPFEVSPYVCMGKPCICNVDDLYPMWSKLAYRLPACIIFYYASGSTMHPARLCGGFWTIFSLKKQKIICEPYKRKNYFCILGDYVLCHSK